MTITPQDAAEALKLVDAAERRSVAFRGYQTMAPHLMLWGVIWAAGYSLTYFLPVRSGHLWWGLNLLGWGISYQMTKHDHQRAPGRKFFGILIAFVAFTIASLIVMAPHQPNQVAAFIAMVVALCYSMVGLFGMPRLIIAGAAIFVLTLFGYFTLPGIFSLWMAVIGGGGLFLGGVWLRRA
jgi:hypothetical protein